MRYEMIVNKERKMDNNKYEDLESYHSEEKNNIAEGCKIIYRITGIFL